MENDRVRVVRELGRSGAVGIRGEDPAVVRRAARAAVGDLYPGPALPIQTTTPRLPRDFFARSVHDVARDLIGCTVAHGHTAGVIVETESYHADDPACHAFGGPTPRSSVLFGPPAHAYVYLSYGIHSLLNFVAEPQGEAAAVLIRALEPAEGIETMRARRGVARVEDLCSGPGKLTEALGIALDLNGVPLAGGPIEVHAREPAWGEWAVVTGPRIGISKATDHPWRFCVADSRFVSRPWPKRSDEQGAGLDRPACQRDARRA
jgi:DNA-3-methyladenine glycosylase